MQMSVFNMRSDVESTVSRGTERPRRVINIGARERGIFQQRGQAVLVGRSMSFSRASPLDSRHSNLHLGLYANACDRSCAHRRKRGKRIEKRARPGKIKFYAPRERNVIARPRRDASYARGWRSGVVAGGQRRWSRDERSPFNYKLTALIRKLASPSLVFSRQATPPLRRYYRRRRSTGPTRYTRLASYRSSPPYWPNLPSNFIKTPVRRARRRRARRRRARSGVISAEISLAAARDARIMKRLSSIALSLSSRRIGAGVAQQQRSTTDVEFSEGKSARRKVHVDV